MREDQERLRHQGNGPNGDHSGGKSDQQESDGQNNNNQQHSNEQNKNGDHGSTQNDNQKKDNGNQPEEQPKPPLKQRVRAYAQTHHKQVAIGSVAFVVLCIAGIFLLLYLRSYESTDDAQIDGHLNAVSTRVMGTVQRVYVEDNQTVAAGQLLVELDPRDFETALAQAKANYASAEAQWKAENPNVPIVRTSNASDIATNQDSVAGARAGVLVAEQDYQARVASLRQAEANDTKAQRDLVRYRALVNKEEISHEQYDSYVAAAKTQAAGVVAAQAAADAAQKTIEQRRAQLSQVQARLNESQQNAPRNVAIRQATTEAREASVLAARAQVDQATLNLSYTKIYAPAAGIVTSKSVEVGERVEPGQQLLIVSQTEDIWITANFKETQLRKMHPGQSVDVSVDTFSRKYHGYVQSMPGATGARTSLLPPENATGNFVKVVQRLPVRIRLKDGENRDQLLRPGMSAEPKVWLK